MMEQKHGQKKKKRPSLRKSGTIALKNMDRDLSMKKDGPQHHTASELMEKKMAIALKKAKESGIASSKTVAGMAAFSKSSFIDDIGKYKPMHAYKNNASSILCCHTNVFFHV